ncbi:LysR family transcriptional regulator [Nitratireductor sp. CH_MIT9313-5]|uniref:LysR family transcriptional regulator n=1 Tax=Nitratireductor sp. CH_MIT9313-5 TaxID=3107764 RepID=UPI00300AE9E5
MESAFTGSGQLNWNLLRTFWVIAQEKSITKAAKRLDMRQPSVSFALQRLEEQLGCQLVHRDSRRFELTVQGEKIYRECDEILRSVTRISELTRDASEGLSGQVRLLIVSHLQSELVDEAIRLFHQRHPAITWRIEVASSQSIVRAVAQEQAALGICLLSKPMINLDCRKLFREEFSVFCGAEHPLYGVSEVDIRALQQEAFVSFTCASEGLGLEPMVALREGVGLGSRTIASSPNLEEVRRMIICGLGIGILPDTAVRSQVERGLLWPLKITDKPLGADVFLLSNPNVDLSPAERTFIDTVEELMRLSGTADAAQH